MRPFGELAFTPAVKALQVRARSRSAYARLEDPDREVEPLGEDERAFLADRDSFYMASVGSTSWPYVQHRGGAKGFVRVLDDQTLAFDDLRGNRQYVSVGNLGGDDRAALIFVDYPRRARLKVLARVKLVERGEPEFAALAADRAAERVFVLHVEAFDWNCPQHIVPRYTEQEIRQWAAPMHAELERLRRENAELRARPPG